jgi:serine/threonine protein kinase
MARVGKYSCPHCRKDHPRIIDTCPEKGLTVSETYRLEGEILEGKYEIGERIGEGGMGVVYMAKHRTIGRKLAIKFLHAGVQTSEEVVRRFQNEARVAASIGNKHIVDIIDMGKLRGKFHYIVMEYLEGEDLAAILDRGVKQPYNEAVDIVIQMLSGLYAAHQKGIIHRDLKPENIFVITEPSGEKYIKIVDFGISRLIQEAKEKSARVTKEGTVIGTPLYMSPEQARGRMDMDHRADLFGAGTILYEMLTGIHPFRSRSVGDVLVSIITEIPLAPADLDSSIPAELSEAVMKALAKNPDDRFASAMDFIEAIAPFSSSPIYMKYSSRQIKVGDAAAAAAAAETREALKEESSVVVEVEKVARRDVDSLPHMITQLATMTPDTEEKKRTGAFGKKSITVIVILLIVASLSIFAALYYRKDRNAQTGTTAGQHETASPLPPKKENQPAKQVVEEPVFRKVSFSSLPDGAKVFVDGKLHAERPVLIEDSPDPHVVGVEMEGKIVYKEKIPIHGDIWVSIKPPTPVAGKEKEAEAEEGKKEIKKGSKKKKKKEGKEKGKENIDQAYPTG